MNVIDALQTVLLTTVMFAAQVGGHTKPPVACGTNQRIKGGVLPAVPTFP